MLQGIRPQWRGRVNDPDDGEVAMGISGGLLFSYVKMRESQAAAAAKEAQEVEMKRKETEDVEVQKLLSAVDGGDDDDDMA